MTSCPKYRLRLFLSVDLVGSTAFKARVGQHRTSERHPNPIWVDLFKNFYSEFPKIFYASYKRSLAGAGVTDTDFTRRPQIWKTVGDEIIFCLRLESLEALILALSSFRDSLCSYGNYLDTAGLGLDLKGSAWTASFPAPNITVEVQSNRSDEIGPYQPQKDLISESLEASADDNPSSYDFIGKHMDAGFRIAREAQPDAMVLSIELAHLIFNAEQQGNLRFTYIGRRTLKGIMHDQPYPLICINSERSSLREDMRERERRISGLTPIPAGDYKLFVNYFMESSLVETQSIVFIEESAPVSYQDYKRAWEAVHQETVDQAEREKVSGYAADEPTQVELPKEVLENIDELTQRIATSTTPIRP